MSEAVRAVTANVRGAIFMWLATSARIFREKACRMRMPNGFREPASSHQ